MKNQKFKKKKLNEINNLNFYLSCKNKQQNNLKNMKV